MNQQVKFKYSIDVPGNIVALCPNCHREIHHAEKEDKNRLLRQLFNQRNKELDEFGLFIKMNELFELYKL